MGEQGEIHELPTSERFTGDTLLGYSLLDAGCWILDTRYQILPAGGEKKRKKGMNRCN